MDGIIKDAGRISQAIVYFDKQGFQQVFDEVELPALTAMFEEDESLGNIGKSQYWAGIDAMEMSLTAKSIHPDILKVVFNQIESTNITIRANVMEYESGRLVDQVPYSVSARVRFSESSAGALTGKESAEYEFTAQVMTLKVEYNGEQVLNVDLAGNIYEVGGVDLLQKMRANLGMGDAVGGVR